MVAITLISFFVIQFPAMYKIATVFHRLSPLFHQLRTDLSLPGTDFSPIAHCL